MNVEQQGRGQPWLDNYPEGVDWFAPIPAAPPHTLLQEAGTRFSSRPAFDFLGRRTTWADAAGTATRIAAGLQRLGLKKGDRIGLLLPNCPAYPLLFFGALQAGLTVVNFNPLYTQRELEHQARDAGISLIATLDLKATYSKVAALLASGITPRILVCPFGDMLPAGKRIPFELLRRRDRVTPLRDNAHIWFADLSTPSPAPTPVSIDARRDVAVLQYTGGTSGLPKGAMLSHANLHANAFQTLMWFKDTRMGEERTLAALPFFHVFAMTTIMLFSVLAGAEVIMLPRFELKNAVQTIARCRPIFLPGVPTMFNAIADYEGLIKSTSIRFCISGGAPLPPEVKARFEARTGCVLVEGYGLTEASPCVACNPPGGLSKTGSIGLPVPGTVIELRDPADPMRPVPLGERGELCVQGPQVMLSYWKQPEAAAASITPDGFLRTGDIAVMDAQGYFSIVDRIKDLILAGGYNVYPRIVEDAVYQHPAVTECTVIGVPDRYRGEMVKAFVVLRPGMELTAEALLAFLKKYLSPIEMPKQVEFRDSLPRMLIGKLSKKELVEEERAKRGAADIGRGGGEEGT